MWLWGVAAYSQIVLFMQRLFSTFADGWPGAGLLLLRLFTGVALIHSGIIRTIEGPPLVTGAFQILGIVAGVILMAGLFTPVAGVLAAITQVWIGVSQISTHLGDPWSAMAQATLAAGLAMIGPGAWSIDARRFGRKRITLSDRSMIADVQALPSLERTTLDGPIQVLSSSNQITRQTSQGMMFVANEGWLQTR